MQDAKTNQQRCSGRNRNVHRRRVVGVASALLALAGTPLGGMPVVRAQEAGAPSIVTPRTAPPEFLVSRFAVAYEKSSEGLPSIDEVLSAARVALTETPEGFVAATDREAISVATLNSALATTPRMFSREALDAVNRAIVRAMSDAGYIGILVATSPDDLSIDVIAPGEPLSAIENVWTDLRPEGASELNIIVYTARVVEVRTVASGDRVPSDRGVNHPAHESIRARSPIAPGAEAGGDILRRDVLDQYTLRLNRYPGRRVDVAVSAAENPGDVTLDYLVRENKPWFLFAQIANNGTEQTEVVRERFGFVHNQLTGNDDQLIIDYTTAGFAEAHAVAGSYEFPIGEFIRVRPFATYSKFDASEVGFADEDFEGESWSVGGDAAWNFFQKRELFIDLIGGVRWESVRVNNKAVALTGRDGFLLPSLGLRLERYTDEMSTNAYLRGEFNLDEIAATGDPSLENLGRTNPDEEFVTIQWGVEHRMFLEPLLDAKAFREGRSTLAHEMAFRLRAQHSIDARLAPTFQDVVGGIDSVRGYPQSAVAGDDVYVGSVEYRLHIPNLLEPYDERNEEPGSIFGQPFRARPQTRYARPDWDLIGKAFLDVGRAENEDRLPFETDETLIGAGVGVELLVGRNINLRLDYGVALREVEEPTHVTAGSSRVHFVVTLLY